MFPIVARANSDPSNNHSFLQNFTISDGRNFTMPFRMSRNTRAPQTEGMIRKMSSRGDTLTLADSMRRRWPISQASPASWYRNLQLVVESVLPDAYASRPLGIHSSLRTTRSLDGEVAAATLPCTGFHSSSQVTGVQGSAHTDCCSRLRFYQ